MNDRLDCQHEVVFVEGFWMSEEQTPPQRKQHRLAMSAYAATEYEYYFTVCARHQGEPFRDGALARIVIASLMWTRANHRWLLYCYCLMPDHLHFVCRLTNKEVRLVNSGVHGVRVEGVLDHLARFKSYTTNQSWDLGVKGALWQKSSYDRVLDLERPFIEVIDYTLNNPVRKGFIKEWEDWPYCRIVDPWWE